MSTGIPLRPSHQLCISKSNSRAHQSKLFRANGRPHLLNIPLSSRASWQDLWSLSVSSQIYRPLHPPYRCNVFTCQAFALPGANGIPLLKSTALTIFRSCNPPHGFPLFLQLCPAIVAISFALWGLEPLIRCSRCLFFGRNDATWRKSQTHYVYTSYVRPLLLWGGAILICRVLDPVILQTEASQDIKQRLLHFIRSLSTVLAFSYCLSRLVQQVQKFLVETNNNNDTRNMGFQFAGKAIYTSVWVAAVSLFMELLGFSTQKWLTAGGLGTVLLTLAGREIFTNFLSSIMIHATRPFVINEWIQTNIQGYEVSGTVEQVGWWSPTIIRGEDREAIHIPNHKFTVNVVRNLTQKTHWRVKTHLGISHLDANKINNIVADMRKVLAKSPHVEQQRLHRRVFLEYINPENQAFMILISCFVKTSHFEEYLCVKEAILLDLLRVIGHHRARLATPIRTVQKIYSDVDSENIPYSDAIFTRGRAPVRGQLYLTDSTSRVNGDSMSRINGDDKMKSRPASIASEEHHKTTVIPEKKNTGPVGESTSGKKITLKDSGDGLFVTVDPLPTNLEEKQKEKKTNVGDTHTKSNATNQVTPSGSASSLKSTGSKPSAAAGKSRDSKPVATEKPKVKPSDGTLPAKANGKNDSEGLSDKQSKRPCLEENIVLGLALEGAKRTLPIDESPDLPTTAESKEAAPFAKANASPLPHKDKKTGPASAVPDVSSADKEDQERG